MSPRFLSALVGIACGVAKGQCDFTTLPASPTSSFGAISTVYDSARQRIVVVQNSSQFPMRLHAWNGSAWELLTSSGPLRQFFPAAAYDIARDRIVVYGGLNNTPSTTLPPEVWEWDGAAWNITTPATSPIRRLHTMVYDAAIARVVMYGGTPASGVTSNETWLWDGSNWTDASSPVRPPARDLPQLAYDSARGRVIYYGPSAPSNSAVGDVWEFDGALWTQRSDPAPWRSSGAIAYDSVHSKLLLIDGNATSGVRQGWDFDAASGLWSLRARSSVAFGNPKSLVFDPGLGHAVFATGAALYQWNCESTFGYLWITGQPIGGTFTPGTTTAMSVGVQGTPPYTFQWYKNGVALSNGGSISGADSPILWLANMSPADGGPYSVVATNAGGTVTSNTANITIQTACGNPICYANCDGSTGCPILTPNDFMCFFNKYAAEDVGANCDGTTHVPVLNANDFQCFLNAYASGCP